MPVIATVGQTRNARHSYDDIAASSTPAALVAKNATRTIPIVGMSLTEPVGVGLVASLARPGGNITGVAYGFDTDIFGKQLELLKEVIPEVRRVAGVVILGRRTSRCSGPRARDARASAAERHVRPPE